MVRVPGRFTVSFAALLAITGLSCPQSSGGPPEAPAPLAQPEPAEPLFAEPLTAETVELVEAPDPEAKNGELVVSGVTDDDPELGVEPVDPDPEGAEAPEAPAPIVVPPEKERFELAALRKETWVFAEPRWGSRKIGYLRSGAVVRREEKAVGHRHCRKGWFRIEPKGYVCVGKTATLETHHPIVEAAGRAPNRREGLPYAYAMSKYPTPPFYTRLPTKAEQRKVEPDLAKHLGRKHDLSAFQSDIGPVPGSLLYERTLPTPDGESRGTGPVFSGRPVSRSGFGLLHVFSWTDRLFGITTDLDLIPLDRTKPVHPSSMNGIHLVEDMGLPIAFVRSQAARLYRIDLETRTVEDAGEISYRQGFTLTGRRVRVGEHVYLETQDHFFVRENSRVVVLPPDEECARMGDQGAQVDRRVHPAAELGGV